MYRALFVLPFIFVATPLQASAAEGDMPATLRSSDFEYIGAYRQPHDTWYMQYRIAIRWVDGQRRMFMTTGGDYMSDVLLPEPKIGDTEGSLPKPTIVKAYTKWAKKYTSSKGEGSGKVWGIFWDAPTKRLYYNYGLDYNASNQFEPCYGYSVFNDTTLTCTPVGCWKPDSRSEKLARGGACRIPDWFAKQYTSGRTLGLGWGGYYSICASASPGLALCAVEHPNIASVPDRGSYLWTQLAQYSFMGSPEGRARRDGDYKTYFDGGGQWPASPSPASYQPQNGVGKWTWSDSIGGAGCWVDVPGKSGVILFPTMGNGNCYYYGSDLNCERRSHWWYVWDPAELAKVAQGKAPANKLAVGETANVKYPFIVYDKMLDGKTQSCFKGGAGSTGNMAKAVVSATFDPVERRLYLSLPQVFEYKRSVILVYKLK